MPTIQISKLQMRRGPFVDLPNPSLDDGEIGFANDTGRLFIGQTTPTIGNANYNRAVLPYENIEILTELTPLDGVSPAFKDNQLGYFSCTLVDPVSSFSTSNVIQTLDSTMTLVDFYFDLPNSGANALINYFVYDSSNNPLRVGKLTIIWNTNMVGDPYTSDDALVASGNITDIQWKAVLIGSMPNQHVVLEYINDTGDTPKVYFRLDRPLPA